MDIVHARIGCVQDERCFHRGIPCRYPPHAAGFFNFVRLMAVQNLHLGQLCQLFQEPVFQHLGIISILGGQKCAIAHTVIKVALRGNIITADLGRGAEAAEFGRIGPAEMCAGGIDLVKACVQAEIIIPAEALEVMCALDGRGVAARVMVAHVYAGLIDIGRAHERGGVPLQHQYPLACRAALLGCVQAIQASTNNDFIHCHAQDLR